MTRRRDLGWKELKDKTNPRQELIRMGVRLIVGAMLLGLAVMALGSILAAFTPGQGHGF